VSNCPECNGALGTRATKCRCGWKMPGTAQSFEPKAHIDCCYAGCTEGAICKVFTKTGWANVCNTHYPKLARENAKLSYSSDSPACIEGRKAWENSPDYRAKHGLPAKKRDDALEAELAAMKDRMAAFREPGEDLEEELADIANP